MPALADIVAQYEQIYRVKQLVLRTQCSQHTSFRGISLGFALGCSAVASVPVSSEAQGRFSSGVIWQVGCQMHLCKPESNVMSP